MINQYYKIISISPLTGTIIDTKDTIDYKRINRFSELTKLFDLIFNCSLEYNLPIGEILYLINANILTMIPGLENSL